MQRNYTIRLLLPRSDVREVAVTGSHSVLGLWKPESAPKMTKMEDDWYQLTLKVSSDVYLSGVEYKFIFRTNKDSNWIWEQCPNRILAPIFVSNIYLVVNVFDVLDSTNAFAKVVSFNLRYDNPGDGVYAWPNRRSDVIRYVKDIHCDILCVQEAFIYMVQEIQKGLGDDWKFYAVGRDNGFDHGESSGILFDGRRWETTNQGTFWLSEEPDRPGSRSWGAACVRICSWVRLRHRLTGKSLCVFNTHLDHISTQARDKGLKLILNKMINICQDGIPYVLTGDFNMLPSEGIMSHLTSSKKSIQDIMAPIVWAPLQCEDPASNAVVSRHPPTFTGFTNEAQYLIDYILVHPSLHVVAYEVLTNRPPNSTVLSDHVPLAAHITF